MNERRPKGLGTVEKVGEHGYRARRTINGQRVCGTTRKTRLEAECDLRTIQATTHKRSEIPSLADYAKQLLEDRFKKRHKQTTWETHEVAWRVYLSPSRLGRIKLDKIKRRDAQEFIDGIHGKSARYVRRIGNFLSMVLTEAVKDEYIAINPSIGLEYPKVLPRENRTLNPEEAIKLLNPKDRLGAMILVAVLTGLRRGELCGLQWDDIRGDVIRVRHAIAKVKGGPKDETPKTKKSISNVPLAFEARQALESQPKRCKYVFSAANGKPVSPDNLTRDFRLWAQKHGLAGMRLHDLRGSYVSLLIESGADIRTVQALARHSDARTTMEAYARSRQPVQEQAIEGLRRHLVPNIGNNGVDSLQNRTQVG